jgi:hypothetical protein
MFVAGSTIQSGRDEGYDPVLWVGDWRSTEQGTTLARTAGLQVRGMASRNAL